MNSRTKPSTILFSLFLFVTLAGFAPSAHVPVTRSVSAPATNLVSPAVVDPPPPDFSLNCNPTSLTFIQGATGVSTCTVSSANSFTGNVRVTALDDFGILKVNGTTPNGSGFPFSFIEALSAGGTASFHLNVTTPSTCTLAASCYFVYPVVLLASSPGPISHSFLLETVVNPAPGQGANLADYSVGLSASSVSIAHGNSASPTITLTGVNGWAGAVNLAVLNSTVSPAFSFVGGTSSSVGTFVNLASFTTSATATLTITTTATTTLGTYIVIVQMNGGTTGTQPVIQHTAVLTVTVT